MAKKELTPIEKEYNNARRALQSQVRAMKKRGYHFKKDIVPKKPQKIIPGSTRRLQNIQKNLYEKSWGYVGGEKVSGKRYFGEERARRAERRAEQRRAESVYTVPTLWEFIRSRILQTADYLRSREWDYTADRIETALDTNAEKLSTQEYGKYLDLHWEEITYCCDKIEEVYDSDKQFYQIRQSYVSRLIDLLSGEIADAETMREISEEIDSVNQFVGASEEESEIFND